LLIFFLPQICFVLCKLLNHEVFKNCNSGSFFRDIILYRPLKFFPILNKCYHVAKHHDLFVIKLKFVRNEPFGLLLFDNESLEPSNGNSLSESSSEKIVDSLNTKLALSSSNEKMESPGKSSFALPSTNTDREYV
jgi:hypothetical protein